MSCTVVAIAVYLWAAFAVAIAETSFMGPPPGGWPSAIVGWLLWPVWPLVALLGIGKW